MMRRASPGAILIAVLWSIVLLSALAMAASTTFRGFAGLVTLDRDRVRADALLSGGLEVAAGMVGRLGETPLQDLTTQVLLPGGKVQIRLTDESGRIDIGKAPVEMLAALFRSAGARDAETLAERIAGGRKPAASAEEPVSEQEDVFTDVRQLTRVPGVTPQMAAAVAPLATVFGNATVNPLTAPAEVIAALPGVSRGQASAFLQARARYPDDATRIAPLLGPAQRHLEAAPLKAVSARLTARLDDGYTRAAEAVLVVLANDSEPYRLLAWNPLRVTDGQNEGQRGR